MESINDISVSTTKSKSFLEYLTSFEDDQKYELLNMFQYALLIVIPVILLNKGIGELFTSTTDEKTSMIVSMEIVAELFVLLFGIFMIHRIVCYIPTYSEKPYTPFSLIGFVFSFIVILFSFDTNLRAKFEFVFQDVYQAITGKLVEQPAKQESSQTKTLPLTTKPTQVQRPPEYVNQQAVQHIPSTSNTSVSSAANTYQQNLNEKPYEFPQQYPDTSNTETFSPEPFGGF